MSTPRKAAFAFVFVTVALDMLAIGIIIPVLPRLIEQFMAGNTARAAEMVGLFSTLFAATQFILSPVLGALSDRFGRRPVILLSNLGLGLDYIFMALAPSLWILLIGRLIAGATSASVATAGAYIADVTAPEKRAQTFGLLGAAFGLGFVLGPAIGGILGDMDLRYPFWAAAGMSLLNFCYGFFVLPESLAPANRTAFNWRRANPIGSVKLLLSNRQLWTFGSAIFLSQLAHTVLPATFVLYAGYRYGWSSTDIGILLAAVGVASMAVQGGLVKPVIKRIGERAAAIFGLTMGGAAMLLYGSASEGWMVWLGVPVAAFWGLFNATAQSIMSRNVGATEQGKLQGANTSIMALSNIIGPSLFAFTFAWGIDATRTTPLPGTGFWLAGAFLFLAALSTYFVTRARQTPATESQAQG
jgi:MFS transporter, DHA1 family, tetracycline resistance protein